MAVAKKRANNFIRITSVPPSILGITIVASWIGMVATIILHYPLWVIGLVTILPWVPIFFSEALWKYRHYAWFALFEMLMVVQCLHFVEHIAQIVEVDVVGWPRLLSTGILGSLDLEYVHFTFDTTLLIMTTILLFGKFRRNIALWIAWVVAIWHTAEHWYITYYFQFDYKNYLPPPAPGLHAREGLLGADGLLWPSSPFQRIELHFLYNLLYTIPLVWAFVLVIRDAYDEYLKKAFPRLSEAQLASLNTQLEAVQVQAGETIIRQGDPADKFYILAKGEVEILQEVGGQPTVVNRLTQGQFFGEVGLMTGAPRNASVRAITRCELLALDRDTFRAVVGSSVPTAQDYAQVLAQRSGARIPAVVAAGGGGSGSGFAPPSRLPINGAPSAPLGTAPPTGGVTQPPAPHEPPTYVPPVGSGGDDAPTIISKGAQRSQPGNWTYGLVFTSGPQNGQGIALSAERLHIGREVTNELRLSDDAQVSRHHAELLRAPNGDYQIHDLGSANGVFVNDQRLAPNQTLLLHENDELRIGSYTLALRKVNARVV